MWDHVFEQSGKCRGLGREARRRAPASRVEAQSECRFIEPVGRGRDKQLPGARPGPAEATVEADGDVPLCPLRLGRGSPRLRPVTWPSAFRRARASRRKAPSGQARMGRGRRRDQRGIGYAGRQRLIQLRTAQDARQAISDLPTSLVVRFDDAAHLDFPQRRQRGQMVALDDLATTDQGQSHGAIAFLRGSQPGNEAGPSSPPLQPSLAASTAGSPRVWPLGHCDAATPLGQVASERMCWPRRPSRASCVGMDIE